MKDHKGIDLWIFGPPFLLLLAIVIVSLVNYDSFVVGINGVFNWVTDIFGWAFSFITLCIVAICLFLMVSPVGKIKFGGEDAKPDFRTWEWFAMSLCSSIGIGVVFWGVAEPINHLATPPVSLNIEPFSQASAVFAVSTTYLHWSFSQYAIYAICALPIALAYYNYKQPLTVASSLYFIMGDKCHGWIGKVVDGFCLFAIAGAVAGSLGSGILQIGRGLDFQLGIAPTKLIWAIIAAVIVASYILSSYSGLKKGIRFLSNQNVRLYIIVMLFIFLVGPTIFILNLGVQSLGDYIQNFVSKSLFINPIVDDKWPSWWTTFYWEAAMAFAPIIGMFMARITRGRTVRQFLAVNLIANSVFNIIWFAIFGGAAIKMQLSGVFDISNAITTKGLESAIFAFFQQFPLGFILGPLFVLVIFISFVTLADSMTSCMATLSTKGGMYDGEEEAPNHLKIAWGVICGFMAYALIGFAGVDGAKMAQTVAGTPIMFLMLAMIWSLLKVLYWPDLEIKIKMNYKKSHEVSDARVEQ